MDNIMTDTSCATIDSVRLPFGCLLAARLILTTYCFCTQVCAQLLIVVFNFDAECR